MKVFVTGNKGFVGSAVAENLKRNHYDVKGDTGLIDIRNDLYYKQIIDFDPDVIVHCAALMGTEPVNNVSANKTYDINVKACLQMANLANHLEAKLIYCASTASYEPTDDLIVESSPVKPITWYGMSKALGETEIHKTANDYCSLRLSMCFGPKLTYSLIPRIIKAYNDKRCVTIHLDPQYMKDFLYYLDLGEAFRLTIEKSLFGIYNVSRMDPRKVSSILHSLKKKGIDPILYVEGERDYMRNHIVSSEKFRRETKWNPKISVEEGIDDCILKMS